MTTVPDQSQTSSPTVTGATNVLSTPVLTFLPIVVRPFGRAGLVREVRGHVPGGDVRVLADVGVADVRQVRHLRARADPRLLDLHECARLRSRLENGSGSKVTERADRRTLADRRRRPRPRAARSRPRRPTLVEPRSTVNGWTTTSASSRRRRRRSTSSPGRRSSRPASMCASLIRSRRTAAATASSARVLIPIGASSSGQTQAAARPPAATMCAIVSVR